MKFYLVASTTEVEITAKEEGRIMGIELEKGLNTDLQDLQNYLMRLNKYLKEEIKQD